MYELFKAELHSFRRGQTMSRLAGKVALITGTSKGIGTATRQRMGAAGLAVAVTYASDRSSAEAAVTAITASGAAGARSLFPSRNQYKGDQMNTSSNLLVLGATGLVGKLVAKNLRRSDAQFSVGSRRKANLEELADQFGASRFIDLDDPRTFDEALKNVTGLFLITGYTVDMLVQSKTLIDAAKRNGVKHIVHLGAFTREDTYTTVFAWHQ